MPVIFSLTITINHSFFWHTFRKIIMFNVKLKEWTTNYRKYNNFLQFSIYHLIKIAENTSILHFSCILSTTKPQKVGYVIGKEMIGNHNHFAYRLKWFITQKSRSFGTWLWLWLENRDWSVRSAWTIRVVYVYVYVYYKGQSILFIYVLEMARWVVTQEMEGK